MRVLFVSPFGEVGGAERCLLDMLAALGSAAPELERALLLLADGALADEASRLGVKVRVLTLPESWRTVGESGGLGGLLGGLPSLPLLATGYLRALRAAIVDVAPDIVHTNGVKAHLLCGVAAPRATPLIMHLHDFPSHRPLTRHALRLVRNSRVLLVAVSNAVAADCRAVAPLARVTMMYNAVDTEQFCAGPGDPDWLSREAGLAPAERHVAFGLVATYARWKGHDVFLRAAARLLAAAPAFSPRFYMIGGPIYDTAGAQFARDELERLVDELALRDHVGFVPFTRDIANVYRALDVVVHASSRREAFGRTIVEAMACERPVIVSAGGGAKELFREGVSALGFEPGDDAGLASAMLRLGRNRDEASSMAREARRHAVMHFDRRRLGAELSEVYQAALAGS